MIKLFCSHKRTTFPMKIKDRTYICCLECGKEFEYSWEEMRIVYETKQVSISFSEKFSSVSK